MDASNDNEKSSWSTVGWQAALIVNKLRCQAQLGDTSKFSVEGNSSPFISSGSIVDAVKRSEPLTLPVDLNVGGPSSAVLASAGTNTLTSMGRSDFFVGGVEDVRGLTEIANPIIRTVAVDVVELVGQVAVHVKPSQPVRIKGNPVELKTKISEIGSGSGNSACIPASPPKKLTGVGAIIEQTTHTISGNRFSLNGHSTDPCEPKHGEANGDAEGNHTDDEKNRNHRRTVDQRLREMAAFERKVSGNKN